MNIDVFGEGFGEFEAVVLAALFEVEIQGEVVFVKLADLAGLDIADNHVDVFDAGLDELLY